MKTTVISLRGDREKRGSIKIVEAGDFLFTGKKSSHIGSHYQWIARPKFHRRRTVGSDLIDSKRINKNRIQRIQKPQSLQESETIGGKDLRIKYPF